MQILDAVKPLANAPQRKRSKATAKTPEGKVKQRVKEQLDELNCYWFMPVTGGYSRSGVPDFIACIDGHFIGIETKSIHTTHGVTKLQEKNLQSISQNGGIGIVVDENNVETFLKDIGVKL